jgi:phenylacetic acid degradation operon negative regulatory protein
VATNAKGFLLDLMSTVRGRPIPVRALVAAGAVFGIGEDSIRVTLVRLQKRGLVQRNERGQYRVARAAQPIQRHVAAWAKAEAQVVAWRGAWVGVHVDPLAGSRRSQRQRRQRALGFVGFRLLRSHLWIRPDNLVGGVAGVRKRLRSLGVEEAAPVFALTEFDAATEEQARGLWNVRVLRDGYRDLRAALRRSARRLPTVASEQGMVESFRLGGRVIHQIVFDPLLPEPMVPARERRALVDEMRRYDRLGRACWRPFMQRYGAPHLELPLDVGLAEERAAAAAGSRT